MKTEQVIRERIHQALRASDLAGSANVPPCAFDSWKYKGTHTRICDDLVEEFTVRYPGDACTSSNLCTSCPTYVCSKCNQLRPWCMGASDDKPEWCDNCWAAQRGPNAIETKVAATCSKCGHAGDVWIDPQPYLVKLVQETLGEVASRLLAVAEKEFGPQSGDVTADQILSLFEERAARKFEDCQGTSGETDPNATDGSSSAMRTHGGAAADVDDPREAKDPGKAAAEQGSGSASGNPPTESAAPDAGGWATAQGAAASGYEAEEERECVHGVPDGELCIDCREAAGDDGANPGGCPGCGGGCQVACR